MNFQVLFATFELQFANILDTTPPVTTITPTGGLYNIKQSVTLTVNEPATIYYTLDGTQPTTNSKVYIAPINITSITTLKYFAKDTAGNEEYAKSLLFSIDTTAPNGSIVINGGAGITNSGIVTLTLSATDVSGVGKMQFSIDNTTWFPPEPYLTTKSWTFLSDDGMKSVYVEYMDNAGNWSDAYSSSIILDTTPPTGSITINGGASRTNNGAVILSLSAIDANSVTQMKFSNDNAAWSFPESYAITKNWTLSLGDGKKTVYVKFKDNAENWSPTYSAGITLSHLVSINITSPKTTLIWSKTLNLKAEGVYSDGFTVDLTTSVDWNSSNLDVGRFGEPAGTLRATAVGTTNLKASAEGVTSNTIGITVAPLVAKISEITMVPEANVVAGSEIIMTALIRDGDGDKIDVQSSNAVNFTKISGNGKIVNAEVINGDVQVVFITSSTVGLL